jgi:hypothetical protein
MKTPNQNKILYLTRVSALASTDGEQRDKQQKVQKEQATEQTNALNTTSLGKGGNMAR